MPNTGVEGGGPTATYQRKKRSPTPLPTRPPVIPTTTGQYTTPAPPPLELPGTIPQIQKPPSIQSYLGGDTGYQDQMRQFARTMKDYVAEQTQRRTQVGQDYDLTRRNLAEQKTRDLTSMEEDFGARGLLSSGLYGKSVGDYNTEFLERLAELTRGRDRTLTGFEQELARFRREQELATQAAREAAIRRRAETYGLG